MNFNCFKLLFQLQNFSAFLTVCVMSPVCDDKEFYIVELKTLVWCNICNQKVLIIDQIKYGSQVFVCELKIIEKFYDENKSNQTDLYYDSDTKDVKILKITSIKANSGIDAAENT